MHEIKKIMFSNTNCCVPKCHSRASRDVQLSFHRFPPEKRMLCKRNKYNNDKYYISARLEWTRLLRIGKKISNSMVVCSKHFQEGDFFKNFNIPNNIRKRRRLKRTALPSMCLPWTSTDNPKILQPKKAAATERTNKLDKRRKSPLKNPELLQKGLIAVKSTSWQPMITSVLGGEHFMSDSHKSNIQHFPKNDAGPSVFSLSSHLQNITNEQHELKDKKQLKLWKKVIPTANREFTPANKVCELHFKRSDIITHYVHKFPDGTTQSVERGRYELRPGAVPRFFPSVPYYWFKRYSKRKTSKCTALPKNKESKSVMKDTISKNIIENDEVDTDSAEEDIDNANDNSDEISSTKSDILELRRESEDFSAKTYSSSKSSRSSAVKLEQDFLSPMDVEDHFLNSNHLDNVSENSKHKNNEKSMQTNSNISEHIKCVTHAEAFNAAETLLRYMINQDDVSTADIDSILHVAKKIKQRLSREKGITYDSS